MKPIFEIILANSILISLFLTLKFRVKFYNDKLAWILLIQLLAAYNFYVILTQYDLGRTVNRVILAVFICVLVIPAIVFSKYKAPQK